MKIMKKDPQRWGSFVFNPLNLCLNKTLSSNKTTDLDDSTDLFMNLGGNSVIIHGIFYTFVFEMRLQFTK